MRSRDMSSNISNGQKSLTQLQERFVKWGLEKLSNQEIVAVLVSQNHSYRECRKRAKEAIKIFGNLRGVLSASPRLCFH